MGFVAVKCPQCGADLNADNSREFMFCSYCGTKVTVEKQIVELQGTVSVDGVASAEAIIERADIFLSNKDYNRASEYFDKVLDINPRSSKAYWGLLLCKIGVSSNEELVKKSILIDKYVEYENAVKYGDSNEKKLYENIAEEISLRKNEKAYLTKNIEKLQKKNNSLGIVLSLLILVIIITLILALTTKSFLSTILLIVSIIGFVYFIKKGIDNSKKEKEIQSKIKEMK